AILYYDWLLTLCDEVRLYWQHPFSLTSFFYYLNRYTSLIAHMPIAVEFYLDLSEEVRQSLTLHFRHETDCTTSALLTIRTYALFGRSQVLLRCIIIYIVLAFGVALWALLQAQQLPNIPYDLNASLTLIFILDLSLVLSLSMAFDIAIFFLTLYKCLKIAKTTRSSLISLMMRDGEYYLTFYAIVVRNNVLRNALAFPPPTRYLTKLNHSATTLSSISSTLISRLMLNIRDPKMQGVFSREITSPILDRSVSTAWDDESSTGEVITLDTPLDTLSFG
ncbi:hypothetical protein K474DRAFT_1607570, partial [Panus rudis PR-1116 ss-1]